jgi:hypothetical protein
MPRTQCWLRITREQLRELPPREILHDLFANPEEERTVDGTYSISYRSHEYKLAHVPGLYRGAKVLCVLKPYTWPVIQVNYRGEAYEAEPFERLDASHGAFKAGAAIIGEEYKAPRESETQRAKKLRVQQYMASTRTSSATSLPCRSRARR